MPFGVSVTKLGIVVALKPPGPITKVVSVTLPLKPLRLARLIVAFVDAPA